MNPVLPTIVAICGDAGGANAVAPVIEMLRAEGQVSVTAFAYLQARTLWAERGLDFVEVSEKLNISGALSLLRQAGLVLTGTSVNRAELEKSFIEAARQSHIPSLAVLDFWANYALRFSDEDGGLNYLPDRIAVMDEQSRTEMISEGIDEGLIVITGHPALDTLEAYRNGFSFTRRATIREALGVGEEELLVLFASQPASFFENSTDVPPPWLDRDRILKALLTALEELQRQHRKGIVLAVRPHPRESSLFFDRIVSQSLRVVLQVGGDAREIAMSADLVVGMETMYLVEAAYLGRATLSIRLDLPLPDTFPPNRSGLTCPVYREDGIKPAVEKILFDPLQTSASTHPALHHDASRKVAQLAYQMMNLQIRKTEGA
ncbi:hypothetical protein GALL_297750 [mine drainage metagenome]|uniref:Capsule polysaccharide biosynthesis protein n=1 Tax=mine drainage metagenome TaxID=410659 RepID=A0A1J5QYK0_9ZZZZ